MSAETKGHRGNVPAQEEVVGALWAFAKQIGAPINGGERGEVVDARIVAVRPALTKIMAAFGFDVTSIQ